MTHHRSINEDGWGACVDHDYVPHIALIRDERPEAAPDWPQHLCLDKGYDNEDGWGACVDRDYIPHIRPIRDLRPPRKMRYKPRRWVVERTQPQCP